MIGTLGPFRLRVESVRRDFTRTGRIGIGGDDTDVYTSELRNDDGTISITLKTKEPLTLDGTFQLEQL